MTSLTLRRAAGFAMACALAFGCSGNKPPIPNAFVLATVGPGNANSSVCGYGSEQTFVPVGSQTSGEPSTVSSGDVQPGTGTVTLVCKVDSSGGNNFRIELSAEVEGATGGSMVITGTVNQNGGSSIYASFQSSTMGQFTDSDCTITFTYNGQPIPIAGSPIASGRIWGHVSCPGAMQQGMTEIGEDGGATVRTCDGEADFLFQNCD